jgi:uncharacterized protein YndB with AHSA1/START domain
LIGMEWTHNETIDAPAADVWRLTTDVGAWPTFMPTVRSVEPLDDGPLRLGARARIKQPGQRRAVWTVTRYEPGEAFSWESPRRGITFTGTHHVTPEGHGCRNTLTLGMTGPWAPVAGWLMAPLMRWVLRTENACFKAAAEQAAVSR